MTGVVTGSSLRLLIIEAAVIVAKRHAAANQGIPGHENQRNDGHRVIKTRCLHNRGT